MVNSRGRPKGGGDARARLLSAAQQHVAAGDLDVVSTRALAVEAGVSHTLVNYHFGSRSGLVAEALAVRLAPHRVLDASIDEHGHLDVRRLVRGMLLVWEHPEHGAALVGLARAAASGESRVVIDYLQTAVFEQLSAAVGARRGRRDAVAIVGVLFSRYVLAIPAMASLSAAETEQLLLSLLGVADA